MFFVPKSLTASLEGSGTYEDKCVVLGAVSPSEPREVNLNRTAIPRERWEDVVAHETCHSDLLTSTAYGHAQQLVFRFHLLLSSAENRELFGDKSDLLLRVCLPLGKKLNSVSWYAHEGAAVAYGVIAWQKQRGCEEAFMEYFNLHPKEY